MKKYFHKLTEKEYKELVKTKMTYKQLAEEYPQPEWCNYPGATEGLMGCWSLTSFEVTGEDFCKKCDLYKPKKGNDVRVKENK